MGSDLKGCGFSRAVRCIRRTYGAAKSRALSKQAQSFFSSLFSRLLQRSLGSRILGDRVQANDRLGWAHEGAGQQTYLKLRDYQKSPPQRTKRARMGHPFGFFTHPYFALLTLAASNSSPFCQPTSFGMDAASHPKAKPKRAMAASPVKSISGRYSSLGW